jgi:hypothetical protein
MKPGEKSRVGIYDTHQKIFLMGMDGKPVTFPEKYDGEPALNIGEFMNFWNLNAPLYEPRRITTNEK